MKNETLHPMKRRHAECRALIQAAELPPVAAEIGERVLLTVDAELKAPEMTPPRDAVADVYLRAVEKMRDPERHPYEVTLIALGAATLAEAHGLGRGAGTAPCLLALELAFRIREEWKSVLRPRVGRLLEMVVDGVALEKSKADFIREVRELYTRADRLRPYVIDVDAETQIRFGRTKASYRASRWNEDARVVARSVIGLTNAEGRLVLLVADGRPPASVDPAVLSHARTAVHIASKGAVELRRSKAGVIELLPYVELTSRARRAAQSIRSLRGRPKRA